MDNRCFKVINDESLSDKEKLELILEFYDEVNELRDRQATTVNEISKKWNDIFGVIHSDPTLWGWYTTVERQPLQNRESLIPLLEFMKDELSDRNTKISDIKRIISDNDMMCSDKLNAISKILS